MGYGASVDLAFQWSCVSEMQETTWPGTRKEPDEYSHPAGTSETRVEGDRKRTHEVVASDREDIARGESNHEENDREES